MGLLLFFLFLALFISFLCSLMEAVLLTTPVSYLIVKEQNGSPVAGRFLRYKKKIDQPLSAILSLNTIAHTIGAAGVGAQAMELFGEVYFGIISAILTILILVFSEIIPKTIGARYWRKLSVFVGQSIAVTIFVTYPLVVVAALFTRLFSQKGDEKTTSREELSALANLGHEEGVFGERENKIIQNILRLKGLKVTDIMTPRVVVAAADEQMQVDEFPNNEALLRFSRIPVFDETLDNISGYIFRQEVFEKISAGETKLKLKDIKRDILIAPKTLPIYSLWGQLLERKEHIAIIVDDFGGLEGVVTMEDIIETMLGFEIMDETDTIDDMQEYARKRWEKRQEKYKYLKKLR